MINFNDIEYERVDFEKTESLLEELIKELKYSDSFDMYLSIVKKINDIQKHIEEMCDYADIRNMRNLNDEYFKSEMDYWNTFKPKFDLLFLPYYNEIINSKFKNKLSEYLPDNFFNIIEYQMQINSDKNIDLIKKENDLKTKYRNLNKSKIVFDGEEKTLAFISGFFSNKDRNIRKKAHDAINDYYYEHREEYNRILFDLVNVRNQIARNLGFNNYVQYSLYKLKRFGYDYDDISAFRTNIIKHIIPLCRTISEWQKEELGLNKLEYFDTVYFVEMTVLKKCGINLLEELRKSFGKVDTDLLRVFNNMLDNNYLDLVQRDDKVNFSITNYLTETGYPVVTGNYKNTYLDVQSTTHEIGHSFQKYCASIKDKEYIVSPLLKYPTMEIAEMFSYCMELIMMENVSNLFNEEDYKKYCFMKMYSLVVNLPYICLVDEFQQTIYTSDDLNYNDINKIWIELVKKYQLEKSNSGHVNLDDGGFYYRQSHIYLDPFYYIDYALSYFGAFAIWNNCENDLEFFKEIASIASYYSFSDLINKYNMPSPFNEETIKEISMKLKNELKSKKIH